MVLTFSLPAQLIHPAPAPLNPFGGSPFGALDPFGGLGFGGGGGGIFGGGLLGSMMSSSFAGMGAAGPGGGFAQVETFSGGFGGGPGMSEPLNVTQSKITSFLNK